MRKEIFIPDAVYRQIEMLALAEGAIPSRRTKEIETGVVILGLISRALRSSDVKGVLKEGAMVKIGKIPDLSAELPLSLESRVKAIEDHLRLNHLNALTSPE